MKRSVLLIGLFSLSFCVLGQVKKDKVYKKITTNIDEVKTFKQYLLSRNYQKDFKTSIVYEWREINDAGIKEFCKEFNVRSIRVIPKAEYPSSTDFFIEDDNRIELVLSTHNFFSENRCLVFDCSDEGLKLKDSLSPAYEIADGVFLF
jgi:hypothetical protein